MEHFLTREFFLWFVLWQIVIANTTMKLIGDYPPVLWFLPRKDSGHWGPYLSRTELCSGARTTSLLDNAVI